MQKNKNLVKNESWECMEKRADRRFKKAVLSGNKKVWNWNDGDSYRAFLQNKKEIERARHWGESKHAHKAFREDNRRFRHNRNYIHEAQDEYCALLDELAELEIFAQDEEDFPLANLARLLFPPECKGPHTNIFKQDENLHAQL